MKNTKLLGVFVIIICLIGGFVVGVFIGPYLTGSGFDPYKEEPYEPLILPENFVENFSDFSNPYFPLVINQKYVYGGAENFEVIILNQTKIIMGINCIVVRDTVTEEGQIIEDTYDWFAEDLQGNVWYMGEDTKEYEDGEVVSTEGSWEAGVDGAKPGIVMLTNPLAGLAYRQEYLEGEAEDMALVVSLNETVSIAYGTFFNCLKTKEWSALDPRAIEYKFYAPGIGLLLVVTDDDVQENILTEIAII